MINSLKRLAPQESEASQKSTIPQDLESGATQAPQQSATPQESGATKESYVFHVITEPQKSTAHTPQKSTEPQDNAAPKESTSTKRGSGYQDDQASIVNRLW